MVTHPVIEPRGSLCRVAVDTYMYLGVHAKEHTESLEANKLVLSGALPKLTVEVWRLSQQAVSPCNWKWHPRYSARHTYIHP